MIIERDGSPEKWNKQYIDRDIYEVGGEGNGNPFQDSCLGNPVYIGG